MPIAPEKLAELIDRHWGPLLAWVGRCDGAAEDVVQSAFIKLAAVEPAPDHAVGWLYQASRHLAMNERKSRQRRLRRQASVARPDSQTPTVWQSAEASELIEKLHGLPDDLREIVVARVWGNLSFEEIATMLNASRSTVWRRYGEALSSLREYYGVQLPVKS